MTKSVKKRLEAVNASIHQEMTDSGRNADAIQLVAVSKTRSLDDVKKAIEAGITVFGENYIQEARDKIKALGAYEDLSWHFIGHLQTNKAKIAIELFDLIHTVDSQKLARELDKQADKIGKMQNILIQVNIGKEGPKSGVNPDKTIQLVKDISRYDNVNIKGLMAIPPFFGDSEKARPFFAALRQLRDRINAQAIPNCVLSELSMGMTGDFKVAISEGATIVRIGTAIFGERT